MAQRKRNAAFRQLGDYGFRVWADLNDCDYKHVEGITLIGQLEMDRSREISIDPRYEVADIQQELSALADAQAADLYPPDEMERVAEAE